MSKNGRWVVYERQGARFVHLSKRFETKEEAEKERDRLQQSRNARIKPLGVGYVGSA